MGRKIALLIGVGEYGNGLQPLNCPLNGVREMEAVLLDAKVGGFDEVILLENPDVGTARSRIGEVFAQLTKSDLVLFYFTGHGIKDMTGDFYLATTSTQLFDNGRLNPGTALEADFIRRVIGGSYAQRKVIILDCCFGAAFADGFLTMDDGSMEVEAQLGGAGWVVLTAATSRNYALEQPQEALSVYTRYLVEGLKTGAAALENHDYISVAHLHDYVRAKVKTAAPTMEPAIFNGRQGAEIFIAKATVGDPELKYRQCIEKKIRNGSLRPAARAYLETMRGRLGIAPERARELEAEVLKPYQEKQKHLDTYARTLQEEIQYAFPLEAEAAQDLRELQKLLNLGDGDVRSVIVSTLKATQPQADSTPTVARLLTAGAVQPQPAPEARGKSTVSSPQKTKANGWIEDLGGGVTLEMVKIPGGKFVMGSPKDEEGHRDSEEPQHEVTVAKFWLGKYPVTQAQYQAVMDTNPSHFSDNGANRPVECVSWHDAVAFCEKLSRLTERLYRLPSEAEWEYACRAGTQTPFYFGATLTPEQANYGRNRGETTEVGSFPPNAFGLYDMHGNVWEWCADHWHGNYKGAPTDGTAWLSSDQSASRLLRGGSWRSLPRLCRSATRNDNLPDNRNNNVGFRVVCAAVSDSL